MFTVEHKLYIEAQPLVILRSHEFIIWLQTKRPWANRCISLVN